MRECGATRTGTVAYPPTSRRPPGTAFSLTDPLEKNGDPDPRKIAGAGMPAAAPV